MASVSAGTAVQQGPPAPGAAVAQVCKGLKATLIIMGHAAHHVSRLLCACGLVLSKVGPLL